MLGLETALSVVSEVMVSSGAMTWADVARVMSQNPARISGLEGHGGSLAVGQPANITLVDPEAMVVVDRATSASLVPQQPVARAQADRCRRGDGACGASPRAGGAGLNGLFGKKDHAHQGSQLVPVPDMADLPGEAAVPARYSAPDRGGREGDRQSLSGRARALNLSAGASTWCAWRLVPDPAEPCAVHHRREFAGKPVSACWWCAGSTTSSSGAPASGWTQQERSSPGRRADVDQWVRTISKMARKAGESNKYEAILVLEDGRVFRGESYGATGETFGEGGVLDRHDRLPGDAHRPVVPPAGRWS
jgi:hypothetical protein